MLGAALLAAALALALAAPAMAQTFTVTNLSDSGVQGDGSLRGEIKAANATPGADTIVFAPGLSGVLAINGNGLVIEESLDLEGPGRAVITIEQSSGSHRVFQIKPNAPATTTLAGLTIWGGTTTGSGGAIQNVYGTSSALSVVDCTVKYGYAEESGGGIDSVGQPLTLRSTILEGNEAGNGGGIWAGATAPVRIEGSTFVENISSGVGGGIYGGDEAGGSTVIEGSTFVENQSGAAGGGISYSVAAGATLTVDNSTFVGNTAGTWGGAIASSSVGAAKIEGSTVTGNEAAGQFHAAGGLEDFGPNPTKLVGTIVAGNKSADVEEPDLNGPFETAFDLLGDPGNATLTETTPGSVLVGVDPALGPLADNGGPVETMALPPTSPAVNKGGGTLGTDARGDARPSIYPGVPLATAPGANGADIGAYELQAPAVPVPVPAGGGGSTIAPPPPGPAPPGAVTEAGPRVKLACPGSAGPGGCKFGLQIVSGKPRRVGKGAHAHLVKPTAESAVAKLKLGAGKSGVVTLAPKPRFAARLDAAKSLLVHQTLTVKGKAATSYRRLATAG
jgi:Right handed beta helix region